MTLFTTGNYSATKACRSAEGQLCNFNLMLVKICIYMQNDK